MKKAMLSSFEVTQEDKQWLKDQAAKQVGGSVNTVLRGLISDARALEKKVKK